MFVCRNSNVNQFIISCFWLVEKSHGPLVDFYSNWRHESFLLLNLWKTDRVNMHFRCFHPLLLLHWFLARIIDFYMYLCIILDFKRIFRSKKSRQRFFYCPRKLLNFMLTEPTGQWFIKPVPTRKVDTGGSILSWVRIFSSLDKPLDGDVEQHMRCCAG